MFLILPIRLCSTLYMCYGCSIICIIGAPIGSYIAYVNLMWEAKFGCTVQMCPELGQDT